MTRVLVASLLAVVSSTALASVDEACADLSIPDDYNEQVQQDFMQNYFALIASFSPLHGPVPHAPGRGSVGVDLAVVPPLGCAKRFVLNWTKTEDTNKTPILPRIAASFSFPAIQDVVVPYAGVGFFPSVAFNGTRNMVLSGELGLGGNIADIVDIGARFHGTLLRTYGDVASAFNEADAPVEDVFVGSTWGVDALFGFPVSVVTPYVAVGYLDASTFFFVGDTAYVASNLHPYSGVAFSVGLDALIVDRFRLGGEFYGAPGGYSQPVAGTESVSTAARYGRLYTARLRLGYEF